MVGVFILQSKSLRKNGRRIDSLMQAAFIMSALCWLTAGSSKNSVFCGLLGFHAAATKSTMGVTFQKQKYSKYFIA